MAKSAAKVAIVWVLSRKTTDYSRDAQPKEQLAHTFNGTRVKYIRVVYTPDPQTRTPSWKAVRNSSEERWMMELFTNDSEPERPNRAAAVSGPGTNRPVTRNNLRAPGRSESLPPESAGPAVSFAHGVPRASP